MNMFRRIARALGRVFGATITVRTTYTTSRPMTADEIAAMDRAFAKFNEGFDEIGKAFRRGDQ